MENTIKLHESDRLNITHYRIRTADFIKLDDGKVWIRHKKLNQDYGPFKHMCIASAWFNQYVKELTRP